MKTHPYEWLTSKNQKRMFVALLILTLLVMGGLKFLDSHLITEAAPAGIVSFEFAGDIDTAKRILTSWGSQGKVYAGLSLGFDFLFLFSYSEQKPSQFCDGFLSS